METNKIQWKRIAKGDNLPCQSFLRKKDGDILKLSTVGGVKVGQDCYYLPVDDVINVIKDYPVEKSEDERIINNIREVIGWYRDIFTEESLTPEEYQEIDAWLEKKCSEQHSQCKSELENVIKCLINGMRFYYEDNEEATWGTDKWSMPVKHIIEVLEKQGEHELDNNVEQKPTEWSDEDEANFVRALAFINNTSLKDVDEIKESVLTWLKSLKDRYTWRPSKEQIMALRWVLNHIPYDSHKEEINGLLEQLLKLYNYGENR